MSKKKRTTEQLRTDFLKLYANLPLGTRKEIICVLDDEPMTYGVCYMEIKNETKLSEEILRYLERLELV